MDVFVNSPSAGQLYLRLEASDRVGDVQKFVKERLGIDENDQLVIDLNSDESVEAYERLKRLENDGICSFYVAGVRHGLRADPQKDQEHRLIYYLVTAWEKLSTLMSFARGNIRIQPIKDLCKNTNVCMQELDRCKTEMHMRTIIQLNSESELVDPKQTRGAMIHVNIAFERLKQHFSNLNADVRLIYSTANSIHLCNNMLGKCSEEIHRLEGKAAEVDKSHLEQKRYAEKLQRKVENMFDTASSCQIEGDANASEKIMSIKKDTKDFLTKMIETILKDSVQFTKSLFTGATTNENMDLSEARESVKQFKADVCKVQPMVNIVIQNGKDCRKYCEEVRNRYKEQLSDFQKTQDEIEQKKRRTNERLAGLNKENSNLRGLEERLSERRDELIKIRDNPLKYLWNIVVTYAAVDLAPFTAGLSLGLLGLIQRIDWNDLDSVSDALSEVRRNQRDNTDNTRSVYVNIAKLDRERELLKETKAHTAEKIDKLKNSIAVLQTLSSGVEEVFGTVRNVVQAFEDFENEVTFSFDVEELLKAKSMFYQDRKGTRFTKEEKAVILAGKLEYVEKHIINMLNVSTRMHKVLEDADKMISDVQAVDRSGGLNPGMALGQFKNRDSIDSMLVGEDMHTDVTDSSAYDAEVQVLKTKTVILKRSLEKMHSALELTDQIMSLFSEKFRPLEDITTLYNEVMALLRELEISQHCTVFVAESKNEGGSELVEETSPKQVADDKQTYMDGEKQHDTNTIPPGTERNSLSTAKSESTEGTDEPQEYVEDDQQKKQRIKEKLNEYINAVLDL